MEDGQKVNIDLESPIDTKSSDMLVNINQPQFAHNRQKFQGHCLPSSLRFELDGWAAGDNVYNFSTNDSEYIINDNVKLVRNKLNDNPAYLITIYYRETTESLWQEVGNFCYNTDSHILHETNSEGSSVNETATTNVISGTFNNKHFYINNSLNLTDGELTFNYTGTDNSISITPEVLNNGSCIFTIKDTSSSKTISFTFYRAGDIFNKSSSGEDYPLANYERTVSSGNVSTGINTSYFSKRNCDVSVTDNNNTVKANVTLDDKTFSNLATSVTDNIINFTFNYNYTGKISFAYSMGTDEVVGIDNVITSDIHDTTIRVLTAEEQASTNPPTGAIISDYIKMKMSTSDVDKLDITNGIHVTADIPLVAGVNRTVNETLDGSLLPTTGNYQHSVHTASLISTYRDSAIPTSGVDGHSDELSVNGTYLYKGSVTLRAYLDDVPTDILYDPAGLQYTSASATYKLYTGIYLKANNPIDMSIANTNQISPTSVYNTLRQNNVNLSLRQVKELTKHAMYFNDANNDYRTIEHVTDNLDLVDPFYDSTHIMQAAHTINADAYGDTARDARFCFIDSNSTPYISITMWNTVTNSYDTLNIVIGNNVLNAICNLCTEYIEHTTYMCQRLESTNISVGMLYNLIKHIRFVVEDISIKSVLVKTSSGEIVVNSTYLTPCNLSSYLTPYLSGYNTEDRESIIASTKYPVNLAGTWFDNVTCNTDLGVLTYKNTFVYDDYDSVSTVNSRTVMFHYRLLSSKEPSIFATYNMFNSNESINTNRTYLQGIEVIIVQTPRLDTDFCTSVSTDSSGHIEMVNNTTFYRQSVYNNSTRNVAYMPKWTVGKVHTTTTETCFWDNSTSGNVDYLGTIPCDFIRQTTPVRLITACDTYIPIDDKYILKTISPDITSGIIVGTITYTNIYNTQVISTYFNRATKKVTSYILPFVGRHITRANSSKVADLGSSITYDEKYDYTTYTNYSTSAFMSRMFYVRLSGTIKLKKPVSTAQQFELIYVPDETKDKLYYNSITVNGKTYYSNILYADRIASPGTSHDTANIITLAAQNKSTSTSYINMQVHLMSVEKNVPLYYKQIANAVITVYSGYTNAADKYLLPDNISMDTDLCLAWFTLAGKAMTYTPISSFIPTLDVSNVTVTHDFLANGLSEISDSLGVTVSPFSVSFDDEGNIADTTQLITISIDGTDIAFKYDTAITQVTKDGVTYDAHVITFADAAATKLTIAGQVITIPHLFSDGTATYYLFTDADANAKYNTDGCAILFNTVLQYICYGYIPKATVNNSRVTITTSDNKVMLGNSGITLNMTNGVVEYKDSVYNSDTFSNTLIASTFTYTEYTLLTAILRGVYLYASIKPSIEVKPVSSANGQLTFNIDNDTVTAELDELFTDTHDNNLTYKYTVIDDEDSYDSSSDKTIATLNNEAEFQLIKQQMCTTDEVENYWFIDADGGILVLDKFNFIYKERLVTLNDWSGNNYEEKTKIAKHNILTASVLKFGVTSVNAINGVSTGEILAYIWTIELASNNSVTLRFYNPKTFEQTIEVTLELYKRNLGEKLNVSAYKLCTYSDIQASDFIFDAKYSATSIYDNIIFGIHVDNNFNQWAIIINKSNSSFSVVQGYGFVSMDGTLTGGEIPSEYFIESEGFNSIVEPIEKLTELYTTTGDNNHIKDISELYTLDKHVVGNDNQQWYINKNISGIVSHINYNAKLQSYEGGRVILPINNNYTMTYGSSSFYTRTLTDMRCFQDMMINILTTDDDPDWFKQLLGAFFNVAGAPMLYTYAPRMSVSGYLQQAMGQYAYVHYNSTSRGMQQDVAKDNSVDKTVDRDVKDSEVVNTTTEYNQLVSKDELSFHTQVIKQYVKPDKYTFNGIMMLLSTFAISAADIAIDTIRVNTKQNQSSTNDKGRKFSQVFLSNIDSLASSDMTIAGLSPTMTSAVAAVKTLDMFYSTSDKQHIYAGPGYVNHNFVAQCISQSAVSNQFELNQLSTSLILKAATLWPATTVLVISEIVAKLFDSLADNTKNSFAIVATNGTNAPGVALATTFSIIGSISKTIATTYEKFLNMFNALLDSLGGNQMKSNITAQLSRHTYDIEGKHRYGAKTESFMWPCWGCGEGKMYTDESVEAVLDNRPWSIHQDKWRDKTVDKGNIKIISDTSIDFVTDKTSDDARLYWQSDKVSYYTASCKGKNLESRLPNDMAYVIGAESFLSKTPFRNENIDCGEPVFATPVIQDYIISKDWQLSQTATAGATAWISCKDTKIIDGEPSNIIVTPWFCGVASPYVAIEIKHGINKDYIRPWAVTPEVLALNNTGKNAIYKKKLYHAFDGIGYRIVNWLGSAGMNKEFMALHYCFQANDKFKRSNKLPPNQFLGNFEAAPVVAVTTDIEDKLYNDVTMSSKEMGLEAGIIGEDKDVIRYSLPIFTEFVNTLPATVKALAPYKLAVVDGVTSLCTDLRNTQSAYKAPESVDFTINKTVYRMTPEYICSVTTQNGVVVTEDLVPALGLTYLGATPFEAFFYSQATRQYYTYTGGTNLTKVDMLERFRDITMGRYDFINQEVVMQCLATFDRLDDNVHDDADETDNIMCLILKDSNVIGELPPPVTTIFDTESWFRILSLPCGVTYQGPNRCIINRFIFSDYMLKGIKANKGHWTRVPREVYHPFRKYKAEFENVTKQIGDDIQIRGWTHNQFLLVTSPLGVDSEIDCIFEWEITFAWTKEMEDIYADNEYVCVNVIAETMTPGGKVVSPRVTHIFLSKELFTRSGNFGYYSFRYQSKNGAGNRERLHIWADGYIAVSALQCEYKEITAKRTEQLVIQADVQDMQEL